MGDFKKTSKNTAAEKAAERESRQGQGTTETTLKTVIGKNKVKDKIISAKVYPETWATFTAINRAQGMTNNSVINMLISEYVRNKKEILNS